jgi:5-carboxymethyl-2-hydroxymuconate isomerase
MMPHIILEYSLSVEDTELSVEQAKVLVDAAYQAVVQTQLFKEDNIKVRLHPLKFYRLGLDDCGFIHGICRIHSGKTALQKQQLSKSLLVALTGCETAKRVITVEVVEMDTETYAKALI